MPNKEKREAQGTILAPDDIAGLRAQGRQLNIAWEPNAAQVRMLHRTEDEIFYAGGKYGGKSEAGRMWLVKGNLDRPNYDAKGRPILHNISYVHHPRFLGAVIRLNERDLAEWVDRAIPYYEGTLGGTYTKNPAEFRWATGARIFLGHAKDSNAWTKYQGLNITRFLIEEAGQIPDLETFDMIRSCCRSHYSEMLAQILLTANPGGKGQPWLFDRYIEPKDRNGAPVLHPATGRPITAEDQGLIPIPEVVDHPFKKGETITKTRVWVPSYLTDNPHAMNDTSYIGILATMQNEKMKRAYLFGDWRAFKGTFFENFTRETHTFDPAQRPLASWWRTTGSLDWGFSHESAAYWHKRDPETKQHLVFREFCTSKTDPVELGAELARQSMPDIRAQGSIVFHVSHDLYHQRIGDFTWVELISKGVEKVLGQGRCYIPDVLVKQLQERYRIEGKEWTEDLEERLVTKPLENGIVFRRAPRSRAVGFMHLRTLMRTESIAKPQSAQIDWQDAMFMLEEGRSEDYSAYLRSFQQEIEILPEMLISTACPRLIDAIPKAVHSEDKPDEPDDKHFLGMDSLDSLRYLMAGIRDEKPTPMPKQLERQRIVEEAQRRNPTLDTRDLIWMMRHHAEQEEADVQDGFVMRRGGRGRVQ